MVLLNNTVKMHNAIYIINIINICTLCGR